MIPITKPLLGKDEVEAAREAILSGWVSQGPKVKAFEEDFAKTVGSRFACAVSSCTAALHLALIAVGVKPGDVVITVSHSFIATANAVRYCGAEPVFVDIDTETYNVDPDKLLKVLNEDCIEKNGTLYYKHFDRLAVGESPLKNFYYVEDEKLSGLGRVAAILPVHQMGIPCDIFRIVEIASERRLPVVEDAACAIGSEVSMGGGKIWERIGKPHGDISCFSFHPRKVLTTGDGGMITSNNPDYDAKFRLLRQHGMNVPDTIRHEANKVIFEDYVTTAFNYRMTDIQAAIGIEQLKRLDGIIAERQNLAMTYEKLLMDIPYLEPLRVNDMIHPNWQSYPVKLHPKFPLSQLEIMQRLLDKDIMTRRGIMNAHQEAAYRSGNWFLPNSETGRDRTILLPLFPGMTMNDLKYITASIYEIINSK